MGIAVHGPSALFGSFYHGRQLNHLTTNNASIGYGIADLAISTATGVILRQIPYMTRSFYNNLASIQWFSNPGAILRK